MAAEGAHIDFMFLGPPYLAAGSATAAGVVNSTVNRIRYWTSLVTPMPGNEFC